MAEQKNKNIIEIIWDFMASVKLAIIVFAVIGLSSIVGTLLEQNAEPARNIQILSKLVGDSLAPSVYRTLEAMGFMNMYRSWWFVVFLLIFCSNLLICSLDRFPRIWKLIKEPMKPLKSDRFKAFPIKREITLKGKTDTAREDVAKKLKSAGFKIKEENDEGGVQFYGQKGGYSRLGVYITHISIIIIMIGALVGVFFGFKGYLNLPEGSTYSFAFKRVPFSSQELLSERELIMESVQAADGNTQVAARSLGVTEENLVARMKLLGLEPLGFSVTCEDFDVEFYGSSDMAKEYTSHLTVTQDGKKIMDKWIEVNEPLQYNGYTFYQSSYSTFGDPINYTYKLRATSASGASETMDVRLGKKFSIPNTTIEAAITDFSPALSFDQSGRPFTYTEMMNNPAVKLAITENGKENTKWVMKRYPATWVISGSNSIQLLDVWGAQYTGLQVRKDPGVWIVYLGCTIMSIGLYIAFFMSHRKIWVRIAGGKGTALLSLAANANKGREAFERKIDKMLSLLKEGGK